MYKISYNGDGKTTQFLFVFPFFQVADVRVSVNDTMLAAGTYSVTPNNSFSGGVVAFDTPPAPDDRIEIFRRVALNRVIDYQPTETIDPEALNSDFNFLLAALGDIQGVELDLAEWANIHEGLVDLIRITAARIEDKLDGGGVLGLYNNLVSVLDGALPKLINDYGYVTEAAPNENRDDYGTL